MALSTSGDRFLAGAGELPPASAAVLYRDGAEIIWSEDTDGPIGGRVGIRPAHAPARVTTFGDRAFERLDAVVDYRLHLEPLAPGDS